MIESPKISIVTVCYNASVSIEDTIRSVIGQTYSNIEYIIIDGGSTDNTIDIIKKYQDKISFWVSEPDNGIYNAMNKGIKIATGQWINFMNAGDYFYDNYVLENIFVNKYDADIIYGAVERRYSRGAVVESPLSIDEICNRMVFCHQSAFVSLSLMKLNLFDESYRIISDYVFLLKEYREGAVFIEIPYVVASYDCNGISSSTNLRDYWNQKKELRRLLNRNLLEDYLECMLYLLTRIIKKILPNIVLEKIKSRR